MDIVRDLSHRRRARRRTLLIAFSSAALIAVALIALLRMGAARPLVRIGAQAIDTVRRGSMLRRVRALGTLIAERNVAVASMVDARVERLLLEPGSTVAAGTVLVELNNPEIEGGAAEALWRVREQEALLADLHAAVTAERIERRAALARVESEQEQALIAFRADSVLNAKGLTPRTESAMLGSRARELTARRALERERLDAFESGVRSRVRVLEARVEQARAAARYQNERLEHLHVRTTGAGVLQQLPVETGQQVMVGTIIARVAESSRLKARLAVREAEAKDVRAGESVAVDTRNGIVRGRVTRVDPAVRDGAVTVDVELLDALPPGTRPDQTVEGTIEIERLDGVLFMRRPAAGSAGDRIDLYRLSRDGASAERVAVRIGRRSADEVEILEGLRAGDVMILTEVDADAGVIAVQRVP